MGIPMNRASAVLPLTLACLGSIFALAFACNRTAPPEADAPKAVDASKVMTLQEMLSHNEKAPLPGPPTDADFVKVGRHDADWDLDPADPARDYVDRYILSTQRYGRETPCVSAQPSRVEGGRTLVDTRDTDENGC